MPFSIRTPQSAIRISPFNPTSFFSRQEGTNAHRIAWLVSVLAISCTFAFTLTSVQATDLYWRTDGTAGGTWSSTFWSATSTATGGSGWTSAANAFFTADSTLTFVTNTVGNVSLSDGVTATVTAGGTLTLGGVRTFDIGTGSTLTWTSQLWSTAAGNEGAGIIKNGAGTLNLGAIAANARYDGGFTLNAGTVIVSGQSSFGTGVMTINGGTLQSSGGNTFTSSSLTIGGNFTFAGTGNDIWNMTVNTGVSNRTITNSTSGTATRTFSGVISGTGGITFAGTGGSGGIVLSGANDYTGGTTLNGGLLQVFGSGTLGSTSGALTVNGGTLDLNGTSQGVGNLTGSGGTILNNATATNATLTIGNGNGTGGNYQGVIKNNTSGTGTVALTKTGTGTITLSGTNTYTGATQVNGGTLLISGSTASGSAVSVTNSGSTLGGTGTINGTVTVNSGANILGGAGATASGSLTLSNNLTLNSGSIIELALGASGAHSTLARTGGTWSFSSTQAFNFIDLGAQATFYNNIVTGLAGDPGTEGSWTIQNAGWVGTFSWDGANIDLTMTAVPEVETWLSGVLGLAGIGFMQRRRLFAK